VKVVIAGVSGSLGTHLAKHLISEGHKVTGISRTNPEIAGLEFIAHDLTEALRLEHLDDAVVINSAAITKDGFSSEVLDINLAIARNCLSISTGPQILVSSSSVYDLRKSSIGVNTQEATGNYPFLNSYSKSKFESEQIYVARDRTIILRPHALIGPSDQTLLPRVRKAIRNGVLRLPNAGAALHEFTSFTNFAQAIDLSIKKFDAGWSGNITLNVSDGKATSIKEAITQSLLPEEVEISSIPTAVAMAAARLSEILTGVNSEPRLSRYAVAQLAYDRTYDLAPTRAFLGYDPSSNCAF
jgi:nucleoside-diphosphate-sugar epimerase